MRIVKQGQSKELDAASALRAQLFASRRKSSLSRMVVALARKDVVIVPNAVSMLLPSPQDFVETLSNIQIECRVR